MRRSLHAYGPHRAQGAEIWRPDEGEALPVVDLQIAAAKGLGGQTVHAFLSGSPAEPIRSGLYRYVVVARQVTVLASRPEHAPTA